MFDLDPMARLRGVLRSSPASSREVWVLRELALGDEDGRVRAAATARLADAVEPGVAEWLRDALNDELPSVREAAWTALAKHRLPALLEHAAVTLDIEPSWWVRRAAIWTIAGLRDAGPVLALALDDPQWRVRHAAARALAPHRAFVAELAARTPSVVVREVCRFMLGETPGPTRARPLPVDDDPAVAAQRLETGVESLRLPELVALLADPHETLRAAAEARLEAVEPEQLARAVLPWLDEPRTRDAFDATQRLLEGLVFDGASLAREVFAQAPGRGQLGWAAQVLVEEGELELVRTGLNSEHEAKRGAAFLALLGLEDLPEVSLSLTDRMLARPRVRSAERVLSFDIASATAAVRGDEPIARRAAAAFLLEHAVEPALRLEVALELSRAAEPDLRATAVSLLRGSPALRELLRLNLDVDHGVRSLAAEALEASPGLRENLLELVTREDDVEVLRGAWQWLARLSDDPLAVLARAKATDARLAEHLDALNLAHGGDAPASAPAPTTSSTERIAPTPHPSWRPLGNTGLTVSPLVLSGANELRVEGFLEAAERGLNTFFWEPDATSTTRFLRTASAACQVVAGSYHSGAEPIRRDVETALRRLGRERIEVFLLFWVRSSGRLSDENFEVLERLRTEGKVATFGFSTHLRDVALEAMPRWPVVMTRLSLAHPGAETKLLPRAREGGTGVFTFTSTCYGHLLRSTERTPGAAAHECYQFPLERPGVSATVFAPRSVLELDEALRVLEAPALTAEREAALRAHGVAVRESSSALNHFIRHVPSTGRASFAR